MPKPTSQPNPLRSRLGGAPVKLAGFAALLIALFGTAALAGGAINPDRERGADDGADAATPSAGGHSGSDEHTSVAAGVRTEAAPAHDAEDKAHPVRGLAVADNGLRLVVSTPELRRAHNEQVRFRIVDDRGETVRDFDVEHTKRMHVIVVRRDLAGFQHLHPTQHRDRSWTVALRLPLAGSYRLFADFSHEGRPATLASDLRVDGQADLQPLPSPAATAISDGGYEVRKQDSGARPGQEASLRFEISKDGQTVQPEPYLGAGGHLVALREGDLAFLHVHPTKHGHGESTSAPHGEPVAFAATFPTAGQYRLFLQFKHQGTVQTVAFTQEVK